jgi:hypothetical protein
MNRLVAVPLLLLLLGSCSRPAPPPAGAAGTPVAAVSAATPIEDAQAAEMEGSPDARSLDASSTARATIDPDGDDDPADPGPPSLPTALRFERVGRPPMALQRICDLTALGDALYASHANQPLGTDGASITRYRPDDAKHPFSVAFDWNRPGEPTRGGGAGQGFLRVHAIGGRLFVPDTDPPYAGFGIADPATEGYVFVSDASGAFAPARMPGHRPPAPPTPSAPPAPSTGGSDADAGRAGAAVLPRAYHVLDVIRFRGWLLASTGAVPPKQQAWRGPSPGALHAANDGWDRWTYEVEYPFPWQAGVWRLTYLVRFADRLYAGIQDYDGREPNDYVVFAPPADARVLGHGDVRAVRITDRGGALTLRWYADRGRLYWIAFERGAGVVLRVSDDGDSWKTVALPADAGQPTDVVRWGGAVVALTEWGLWRVDVDPPTELARVDGKRSPFPADDAFCAAPLAVFRGDLYAGGQRDGSLWRLVAVP